MWTGVSMRAWYGGRRDVGWVRDENVAGGQMSIRVGRQAHRVR